MQPVVRNNARSVVQRVGGMQRFSSVANMPFDLVPEGVQGVATPAKNASGPLPAAETTTLANGIKVTSQDTGGHVSSIGVYFAAGSRNETSATAGAAHVLHNMAFKSTENRSDLRLYRDIEDIGATISSSVGRELISYRVDALRDEASLALGIISESVASPRLVPWEIEDAKALSGKEAADAETDPHAIVLDAVHAAAFGAHKPLGRPAVASKQSFSSLSPESVKEFAAANVNPSSIVVAATGMNHLELVRGVEAGLGSLSAPADAAAAVTAAASYTGGEAHIRGLTNEIYLGLAFGTDGWHSKDLFAVHVLEALLGGGTKHAAGSIATQSSLGSSVLGLDFVTSATAFSSVYSDAGLFGVLASATSGEHAGATVSAIAAELKNVASSALSAAALTRAKNVVKASVSANLDRRVSRLEDLATQTMFYGERKFGDADLLANVDSVSASDIKRVAAAALATNPSFVAFGDVAASPSQAEVRAMF